MNVDHLPGDLTVPSLGRFACTRCGTVGADVRPELDRTVTPMSRPPGNSPQSASARYLRTAKGKAAMARYKRSAKGKAAISRYKCSAKGKAAAARYQHSPKGKATQERYWLSERGEAAHARTRASKRKAKQANPGPSAPSRESTDARRRGP
jgi:hypothetical protein